MNNLLRPFSCILLFCTWSVCFICQTQAVEPERGIAVLTSLTDTDPPPSEFGELFKITFTSIVWDHFDGGTLRTVEGTDIAFKDSKLRTVIYFSREYYNTVRNDIAQKPFRASITWKEIPIETYYKNLTSSAPMQKDLAYLKAIMDEYPRSKPLFAMAQGRLDDAQAQLDQGNVLVDGKWISRDQYVALPPTPTPIPTPTETPVPKAPESAIKDAFGVVFGITFFASQAVREEIVNGKHHLIIIPPEPVPVLNEYFVLTTPETHHVFGIVGEKICKTPNEAMQVEDALSKYIISKYNIGPYLDAVSQTQLFQDRDRVIMLKIGKNHLTVDAIFVDKSLMSVLDRETSNVLSEESP